MRILRLYNGSNIAAYISQCQQGAEICERILKDILEIRAKMEVLRQKLSFGELSYEIKANAELDLDELFSKISANLEHLATFYGRDFQSKMKGTHI